jgi:hypothetical protein
MHRDAEEEEETDAIFHPARLMNLMETSTFRTAYGYDERSLCEEPL